MPRCADDQNLAVDNFGFRLEVGRKKRDQIIRRFPVQGGTAEDGQHIDRQPILQNRKADMPMGSDDLLLDTNILGIPRA